MKKLWVNDQWPRGVKWSNTLNREGEEDVIKDQGVRELRNWVFSGLVGDGRITPFYCSIPRTRGVQIGRVTEPW